MLGVNLLIGNLELVTNITISQLRIYIVLKGVYVNNYENFVVWVNKDDHVRIVSAAKGQDIKYVLLRLQKVIGKIEETLKVG